MLAVAAYLVWFVDVKRVKVEDGSKARCPLLNGNGTSTRLFLGVIFDGGINGYPHNG